MGRYQSHTPAALPQGKIPGTHFPGGLVSSRTGLVAEENITQPGFDLRTAQPVSSS